MVLIFFDNLFLFFSFVFVFRYNCKTTKYKGLGVLPFKIEDAYQEFEAKCATLCAFLKAVVKGDKHRHRYASAMILTKKRNKVNSFQKLLSMLFMERAVEGHGNLELP